MRKSPRSSQWTRREALHLIGTGTAGLGFVTACTGEPAPLLSSPGNEAALAEIAPSPQIPIIRTLLDDILDKADAAPPPHAPMVR